MAFEALMDGPIPGENYTKDTRNFPWHRPPEITDFDEAVEASLKQLTSEEGATKLLSLISMGIPVSYLTERFVMSGIAMGKWSPDFAILLAGPVAHIMVLMARGYDIDYDLGIEETKNPYTKSFFDGMQKISAKKAKQVGAEVAEQAPEEIKQPSGGFMGGMPGEEV